MEPALRGSSVASARVRGPAIGSGWSVGHAPVTGSGGPSQDPREPVARRVAGLSLLVGNERSGSRYVRRITEAGERAKRLLAAGYTARGCSPRRRSPASFSVSSFL